MPLRSFPFPFRVGIDICEVSRIHKLITTRSRPIQASKHWYLHRFLSRVLTDLEEEAFWFRHLRKTESEIVQPGHPASRHLAGRYVMPTATPDRNLLIFCLRWAAKEAIMKACPRQLTFHDIIIAMRPDEKPYAIVLDHTREKKSIPDHLSRTHRQNQLKMQENDSLEDLSGQIVPLSISHDGEYATAIALYPEESTFEELSDASTLINLRRSFFSPLDKYPTDVPSKRNNQQERKPKLKDED
jgi:holo-[acyl-carrier protein] synthase